MDVSWIKMRTQYRTYKGVRLNCMCRCQLTQIRQQRHGRGEISWQKSCIICSLARRSTTTRHATGGARSYRGQRRCQGSGGVRKSDRRKKRRRRRIWQCSSLKQALSCSNEPVQTISYATKGPQQAFNMAQAGV